MTQPSSTPPTQELGYVQLPGWNYFGGDSTIAINGDELEDVPELRWPTSNITYHRMRTDSQVDALQSSVVLPLTRLKWSIDPAGAPDEVVEDICLNLNLPVRGQDAPPNTGKRGSGFKHSEHLELALLAPTVYGHMPFELVGGPDANTLAWKLEALSVRMPNTLTEIRVNPDGTLAAIKQGGSMTPGRYSGVEIPANQLAMYAWKREGGNWTGRSMLRPLYKHWILKDRLLRIDAIKNERFGAGIPVAKAPEGGDPAQYQKVASAIRTSEGGGIGLPNGAAIDIKGAYGSLPDTIGSIRYQDEAMARSFLAMFIQLGTTETGSRALGEQFVNFFVDALAAFANWYATTTTQSVIQRIVDWNFGEEVLVPQLVWEQRNEEPLGVEDLANLVDKGALVMDEELQGWVRNRLAMPEYSGGTPVQTQAPTPVAASAPVHIHVEAHGDHDQATHGNRNTGNDKPATPATTQKPNSVVVHPELPEGRQPGTATVQYLATAPGGGHVRVLQPQAAAQTLTSTQPTGHRQPTAVEVRAATDFEAMQEAWEAQTTDLVTAWGDVRAAQIDALVEAVAAAVEAGDEVALATLTAPVLGQDLLLEHMTTMATDAITAAKAEAAAQGASIASVAVEDLADALAARSESLATLLSRSLADNASRNALLRYGTELAGESVAAGVRMHLEELTNAYLNDTLGGALTQAQNAGRRLVMTNADGNVEIYSSELLDSNTCEACAAVDGTQYSDQAAADSDYPTGGYVDCDGGPRCRGTLVAVYGEGE